MDSPFVLQLLESKDSTSEVLINNVYVKTSVETGFKAFFTFLRINKEWFQRYVTERNNYETLPENLRSISEKNRVMHIVIEYMASMISNNPHLYKLIDDWLDNKDIQKSTTLLTLLNKFEYKMKGFTKCRVSGGTKVTVPGVPIPITAPDPVDSRINDYNHNLNNYAGGQYEYSRHYGN